MAVTLDLPTNCDYNRHEGLIPLCYVTRVDETMTWYAVPYPPIKQWLEDMNISYTTRVSSYRFGHFIFEDPDDALLFKLTWL